MARGSDAVDVKAELASLDAGVQSVREKLEEEAVKRDERIRLSNEAIGAAHRSAKIAIRVAVGAIVVGLIGVVTGGIGIKQVHDANAARQVRTVAACEQSNIQQRAQAQAEKDEERARQAESSAALSRLLVLLRISPADLAKLQAEHLRKYDATVDRAHRLRDCSPRGLARYYSEQSTTSYPR